MCKMAGILHMIATEQREINIQQMSVQGCLYLYLFESTLLIDSLNDVLHGGKVISLLGYITKL